MEFTAKIEQTLSWGEQNALGRDAAKQLVSEMRETLNPTALGHHINAMIKRGESSGVVVGFATYLAMEIL